MEMKKQLFFNYLLMTWLSASKKIYLNPKEISFKAQGPMRTTKETF